MFAIKPCVKRLLKSILLNRRTVHHTKNHNYSLIPLNIKVLEQRLLTPWILNWLLNKIRVPMRKWTVMLIWMMTMLNDGEVIMFNVATGHSHLEKDRVLDHLGRAIQKHRQPRHFNFSNRSNTGTLTASTSHHLLVFLKKPSIMITVIFQVWFPNF